MSLEDCSAMYGALVGPGMVVLALALQRVGKAVKMVVAATGGYCSEGISTRQDLFFTHHECWPCTCGACLNCVE